MRLYDNWNVIQPTVHAELKPVGPNMLKLLKNVGKRTLMTSNINVGK